MKIYTGAERWLPIDFIFSQGRITIHWMDFKADPIAEPFFRQTLRKLRLTGTPACERMSNLRAFIAIANQLEPISPAGLIFHVSRCGSSVIANALRQAENVTVLSEAHPFEKLFREELLEGEPANADKWEDLRKTLIDGTVRIYAHTSRHPNPKVIIKCHPHSILQISSIRSIWPNVPFLVLIRDPLEVMMSNLAKRGSWMRALREPSIVASPFGWSAADVKNMSDEDYCARAIGRFCESACGLHDENCRVIDYEHLDIRSIYRIAEYFGVSLPPFDSPEIHGVLSLYAKDPAKMRPFEDDRERKHKQASDVVKEAVKRWSLSSYQALKSMECSEFVPYGSQHPLNASDV